MTLGYRGEGIFYSKTAAEDVTKGDVARLNSDDEAAQCGTTDDDPIGVFAEDADQGDDVSIVVHGIAGVTAQEQITGGQAVQPSDTTAGQVDSLSDTIDVSTGNVNHLQRLGVALEDIAADAEGDVFVNVTPAGENTA